MDYSSITFGMDVLVSAVTGTAGALTVWFSMKGKIDLLENDHSNFVANASTEISNAKHENNILKKDIENLEHKVDSHQRKTDKSIADLKEFIMQMKIDIIQEIHAKK